MDSCQVAGDSVTTWRPAARSYQALCRTPWCPGWTPVFNVVWLARVTVGREAKAPWASEVPRAMRPARWGMRPSAAAACSTLGLAPSISTMTTWSAGGAAGSNSSSRGWPSVRAR